ncbi:MAG TPA: hypothetical protein VF820_04515, partial [Patescibacteria group bacterium]
SAGEITLKEIQDDGKKTIVKVKDLLKEKSDLKPGLIKRPTAQQQYEKNKPQEEKAAEQAMVETLDQIPELKEAKEKIEEMKKGGIYATQERKI